MPELKSDQSLLDQLAEKLAERYRRGERPAISEYVSQHPRLAAQIEEIFPALAMMEQVDHDLRHRATPPATTTPAEPSLTQLGDFRIIREVGRGGMGIVYEAEQVSLGRRVALKLLPKQALLDTKHKKRFLREAKAAARLHHTNIVPVFGVGQQDGLHYYVMQFIHGLGLDEVLVELQRLREESQASGGRKPTGSTPVAVPAAVAQSLLTGRFERTLLVDSDESDQPSANSNQPTTATPPSHSTLNTQHSTSQHADTVVGQLSDTFPGHSVHSTRSHSRHIYFHSVARIGRDAANALQYAHDQGIIHRDVKPGNLLLDTHGSVWVTDFGLAKAADQQDLTNTGDVLGTLRYMAPEQFDGKADERSDVYSLGLTLYELLALKPAFDETERHKLVKQVTTGAPPRLRTLDRTIPRDLETIVLKSIEKEPSDRYATAEEFAADLCRFLDDQPIAAARPNVLTSVRKWSRRHRPAMWAAVTTLVVSAIVFAGGLGWIARDRAARRALMQQEVTRALQEAEEWQEKGNWTQALTAARRAESLLSAGETNEPLEGRVQELLRGLKLLSRLEQIRTETKSQLADKPLFDYAETDRCYAAAFREFGLEPADLPDHFLDAAGHFRTELASALHDWAATRRANNDSNWKQLLNAAQAIDPDPWRIRVRRAWAENDRAALEALTDTVEVHEVSPATLYELAVALDLAGNGERSNSLLRESQRAYPDDFWINALLGQSCRLRDELDDAIRFLTTAKALRPDSDPVILTLGIVLARNGQFDEAIAELREGIRRRPDLIWYHTALGDVFHEQGMLEEAIDQYHRALELDPESAPTHVDLGCLLCDDLQLYDEAIAEFRKAIRIDSNNARAHHNLAVALYKKGEPDEALVAIQGCLQCDPKYPRAPVVLIDLARDCAESGRWEQAASAFGLALELEPQDHFHWCQYAALLLYTGDVGAYRRACRKMLDRFGDTLDPYIAERVARTCLLAPPGAGESDLVQTLAERAVRGAEEYPDYAWFALTKALAEYRAGSPDSARNWLQQVPQEEHLQHRNVTALGLLAMARHRLDTHEEAAAALAAAQAILADSLPHPDRGESFGEDWHDWLHSQIVCREAEDLITTTRETATDR